ncbi:hypothetical protein DKX38_000767 [Salix brachista]|uniref:Uncharacterized protein n=1 Tax=Salix brachista TaxID=2182728 RepID=A0A5N5P3M1_9ROSI|nr:hypothetical protein DKX38_000767 [Salix brachista]
MKSLVSQRFGKRLSSLASVIPLLASLQGTNYLTSTIIRSLHGRGPVCCSVRSHIENSLDLTHHQLPDCCLVR